MSLKNKRRTVISIIIAAFVLSSCTSTDFRRIHTDISEIGKKEEAAYEEIAAEPEVEEEEEILSPLYSEGRIMVRMENAEDESLSSPAVTDAEEKNEDKPFLGAEIASSYPFPDGKDEKEEKPYVLSPLEIALMALSGVLLIIILIMLVRLKSLKKRRRRRRTSVSSHEGEVSHPDTAVRHREKASGEEREKSPDAPASSAREEVTEEKENSRKTLSPEEETEEISPDKPFVSDYGAAETEEEEEEAEAQFSPDAEGKTESDGSVSFSVEDGENGEAGEAGTSGRPDDGNTFASSRNGKEDNGGHAFPVTENGNGKKRTSDVSVSEIIRILREDIDGDRGGSKT